MEILFWIIVSGFACFLIYRVLRFIAKERYFKSREFLKRKSAVANVVAEHNDVAAYAVQIRNSDGFRIGGSSAGSHAHLATFSNTSRWNYRRDRNVALYAAPSIHNCSLQVVRNAKADPIKYLMKYFNLRPEENTLSRVESLGQSIARMQDAIGNLRQREASLAEGFAPPPFITKHYQKEFLTKVGMQLPPLNVPYPEYYFQYVSAGGNSSQHTKIVLNTRTIDALTQALSDRIRWRKSVAGQRALMTAALRSEIKARDHHTCRNCLVSLASEPHLLLEVDHIVPVSRGGLSVRENLQTLCWRCNRSKSNKLV